MSPFRLFPWIHREVLQAENPLTFSSSRMKRRRLTFGLVLPLAGPKCLGVGAGPGRRYYPGPRCVLYRGHAAPRAITETTIPSKKRWTLEGSSSSGDAQAVEGVADKADAASCGRHRGLCMTREVIICRHPPFINSESGIDDAR